MRQECTDWTYSREPINATISADQWVEAGLAECCRRSSFHDSWPGIAHWAARNSSWYSPNGSRTPPRILNAADSGISERPEQLLNIRPWIPLPQWRSAVVPGPKGIGPLCGGFPVVLAKLVIERFSVLVVPAAKTHEPIAGLIGREPAALLLKVQDQPEFKARIADPARDPVPPRQRERLVK